MPKLKRGRPLIDVFRSMGMARGGVSIEPLDMVEIEAHGRAIGFLTSGERFALRRMSENYAQGLKMTNLLADPKVEI